MLGQLPPLLDPRVLVGSANADDAGVYKINDELAVVITADFFTPIVDDAYMYGAISAANALSDVWAMGGKPVAALNLACFPATPEFFPIINQCMQGGIDKMTEAGVSVIGGHTIRDAEPKFGYAVVGFIHPERICDNSKARPGDAMVLTKPIGTGVLSTGIKRGVVAAQVEAESARCMATLNRRASEVALEVGISTMTDITGFGLVGHLSEVLKASRLQARLRATKVPLLEDALRLADMGIVPGGTFSNMRCYADLVEYAPDVPDALKILMHDTQTSGGLLIFVPGANLEQLLSALAEAGVQADYIGDASALGDGPQQRLIHISQ